MSNGTISMNLGTNFISVKFEIKGDCPNFTDAIAIGNDQAMQAAAKAMSALSLCERREDFDGMGEKITTVSTTTINDITCSTIVNARFAGVALSILTHAVNKIALDTTAALSEVAHQQPSEHDQLIEQMATEIVNGDYGLITQMMFGAGVNKVDLMFIAKDLTDSTNAPFKFTNLATPGGNSGLDRHFADAANLLNNGPNIPNAAFMTAPGNGPWS